MQNTQLKYTLWRMSNSDEYITVKEYNRLATQAYRHGKSASEYMESLGYVNDNYNAGGCRRGVYKRKKGVS